MFQSVFTNKDMRPSVPPDWNGGQTTESTGNFRCNLMSRLNELGPF